MNKIYEHNKFEKNIYSIWEKSGAFSPRTDLVVLRGKPSKKILRQTRGKPFTIIMPPPNANASLHIGHARFVTIQDILTRYHRMKGEPTLWLPGTDHAGIETQYVFEKKLKEQGKSRFDYDQATLYKMIWDYVMENKHNTENQLRALGASCDWTRNTFTLDPKIIEIVYSTFKKLYDDGLIYRGERIINYCPKCGTSFSQLEVNYVERKDKLYYLNYDSITIATTRPETIFADSAVAVNPKDNKYKHLIGSTATIPLINRSIPIIADSLVEIGFGTDALKITPAHDPIDYEIGNKHKLSHISVIDTSGKMINTPRKYVGMKADVARDEVVKDLTNDKLLVKTEDITHSVGTCYKHGTAIEPMLSKQWFIKIKPLADAALKALKNKETIIVTPKYDKIARHWLKNLKDWNISRQIVWGIRIPAYKCQKCLEWNITNGIIPKKCFKCSGLVFQQDKDTFDTWFSSGQWPFATLQSRDKSSIKYQVSSVKKSNDFERFYPTSVMETAYDILPFWVLRMIMLGLYITGKSPFRHVLFHGLVRDKEGQKISKSKGNVINPLEMVEKYGADAVRMSLVWGTLVENDISLSEENIRGQRNFANKIWNIARYVLMENPVKDYKYKMDKNTDNKDILKKLKITHIAINKNLDKYNLSEAASIIYNFVWYDFANIYIEKTKTNRIVSQGCLQYVLVNSLKLLHPFMPYVTEAIWKEIKNYRKNPKQLLISSDWPNI